MYLWSVLVNQLPWYMFKTSTSAIISSLIHCLVWSNGNRYSFCLPVRCFHLTSRNSGPKPPTTSPKRRETKTHFRVTRESINQSSKFLIPEIFFLDVFKQERVLYLPIYKNARLKITWFPSLQEKDISQIFSLPNRLYLHFSCHIPTK